MTNETSSVAAKGIHVPKRSLWRNALGIGAEYFRQYPFTSIASLGLLVVSGLVEGAGVLSLVPLIDVLAQSDPSQWSPITRTFLDALHGVGLSGSVVQLAAFLLIAILIKASLLFAATIYFMSAIIGYTAALRLRLIGGLMDAKWGFFTDESAGRLTNTICQEAQGAADSAKQLVTLCSFLIQTVVYIGSVILISFEFTVAAAVVAVVMYVSLSGLVRLSRREGLRKTELAREYNGRIVDWLHSVKPLKAMGRNRPTTAYLGQLTDQLRHSQTRLTAADQLLSASLEPFIAIGLVGALTFSIGVVGMSPTALLVGAALFARTMGRVGALQKVLKSLATAEASYFGVTNTLARIDTNREIDAVPTHEQGHRSTATRLFETGIRFEDVVVRYESAPALDGVSLTIKRGSLTALLGPSGAGKSTLLDLLARLRDPQSGTITIDGTDLAALPLTGWRQSIGYVPQEMTLLSDSVRNNLLLGFDSASDDEIWRILEQAEVADVVRALPDGLDTWVGERGQKLSGGQRQRLAIARALIHQPELLLLDESTSALDLETEIAICRMLRQLTPGITIVATSHRPELERWADKTIRLQAGRLVDETRAETA